jgi:hypothetical protein
MAPEREPTFFLQELSSLEVEPLEVLVDTPKSGQDRDLDTLTTLSNVDVASILTGTLPTNGCCCCCCISCCCC